MDSPSPGSLVSSRERSASRSVRSTSQSPQAPPAPMPMPIQAQPPPPPPQAPSVIQSTAATVDGTEVRQPEPVQPEKPRSTELTGEYALQKDLHQMRGLLVAGAAVAAVAAVVLVA